MNQSPILGIDFGTSFVCAGVYKNGKIEVIQNERGNKSTPSYVCFEDESILVGDKAREKTLAYPSSTIASVKRLIGRRAHESNIQRLKKQWIFRINDEHDRPKIVVNFRGRDKTFYPEEIASMILRNTKELAEKHLKQRVEKTVISVPSLFNHLQREAIIGAASIAGLTVVKLINEPTAAAIAYGFEQEHKNKNVNILVYDLGAGYFETSLITIKGNVYHVRATSGDCFLGSEDIEYRLLNYCVVEFQKKHKTNLRESKVSMVKLKFAVERTIRALNIEGKVPITLDGLYKDLSLDIEMTREKFEEMCADQIRLTLEHIKKILADAELNKSDVNEIILIGGATKYPQVRRLLKDLFEGKEINKGFNPDEAIAHGAALVAATFPQENNTPSITMLVNDLSANSIGLETSSGAMNVVIPRNTMLPAERCFLTKLIPDKNRLSFIQVYEGEKNLTKFNRLIGKYQLTLPTKNKHKVEIKMKLTNDAFFSLVAFAHGKNSKLPIDVCNLREGLSKDGVQKMITDAIEFHVQNQQVELIHNSRRHLENYLFDIKYFLKNHEEVVGEERAGAETAIHFVAQWLDEHTDADKKEYDEKYHLLDSVFKPLEFKLSVHTSSSKLSEE